MLEDARLYLQKRLKDLDLGRADVLKIIQSELDVLYPGKTRAKSLNEGVLKLITPSAAVASELRLRQTELIPRLIAATTRPIGRLQIQITTLD